MHEVKPDIQCLATEAIELLTRLIRIPSFSAEENNTADSIAAFVQSKGIKVFRKGNNIWAKNTFFEETKPSVLLNSHHDTVKPAAGWTIDPFGAHVEDGKLYGLGSNDAGGCLVSLLVTFLYFNRFDALPFNLIFAATAEEETSGAQGIESILGELGAISFAIVGEPTQMQMGIAEKGLMVLDCCAYGKSGHAARGEGENAIYKAMHDIKWFKNHRFEKVSSLLGPVHMNVTQIQAGEQHNIVPDVCRFTVDIRLNELYTHEQVLEEIRKNIVSEVHPRSTRIKPSSISTDHPVVQAGLAAGLHAFGSPTTSDQALMPFQSVKIGPGDSARSHTAGEFICINEIRQGIKVYIKILENLLLRNDLQNSIDYETLAEANGSST